MIEPGKSMDITVQEEITHKMITELNNVGMGTLHLMNNERMI